MADIECSVSVVQGSSYAPVYSSIAVGAEFSQYTNRRMHVRQYVS